MGDAEINEGQVAARWFTTTHWSVLQAAREGETELAEQALTTLCQTYWYPLYSYVRSRGYNPEDAEDLTQSFFARLLQRRDWERAERSRGKFRYFLLVAMKNFIADQHERAAALKRGGGQKPISFDGQSGEERFQFEPVDRLTPERLFERCWGLALLDQALKQLRAEYARTGKEKLHAALEPFLKETTARPSYADVAAQLGMSGTALRSALHRLRQRYGELVREEIARTVRTAAEVEEEIRHLIEVMSA